MNTKLFVSFLGILANIILALGKIVVGIISKSASILADGINSATDVISSIVNYIGVKISEKPADEGHPYGHEKAEVISGFIITIIIFISGLWIIYEAIMKFFNPEILVVSYLAFGVMGISAGVNGIMSYVKVHFGKKYDSVSLISDGIHSRIDLLVSLTIFAGLFFIKYYQNVDSILAILVGIYILKESFSLGKETTDSLMGAKADDEIEKKISGVIKKEKAELVEMKTQKLGSKVFADLKIKLPSKIKVDKAAEITKDLQKKLVEEVHELEYVSIQIESHDVGVGYYKPGIGKGFGWKKEGRNIESRDGEGPGGKCVCEKCGYEIEHKRGVPCSEMKCPKCKISLKRKNA